MIKNWKILKIPPAVLMILIVFQHIILAGPVFRNPGIPASEYFEITDFISSDVGYVTAKASINLKNRDGIKYYHVVVREGNLYINDVEINHDDLTTISEKRYDAKTNALLEAYSYDGAGRAYLFNRDKKIDKYFTVSDSNIYSRYAYFVAFRGFPFQFSSFAVFKTYMYETNGDMTMKLSSISRQNVTVPAGTFDCYRLELTVTGLISVFVKGKFIFYFDSAPPHRFVKYEEMDDNGKWTSNELVNPKK